MLWRNYIIPQKWRKPLPENSSIKAAAEKHPLANKAAG
jgi:hypothetical protein